MYYLLRTTSYNYKYKGLRQKCAIHSNTIFNINYTNSIKFKLKITSLLVMRI